MVAGGGHRHGGAAAERGEGKGEKRRQSTAHPRSTATMKKAAGAEEGGGAARVDGVDGVPAVGELGEGVDGVDGGAAKPGRETVPASGEGRPEVVGDGGERERATTRARFRQGGRAARGGNGRRSDEETGAPSPNPSKSTQNPVFLLRFEALLSGNPSRKIESASAQIYRCSTSPTEYSKGIESKETTYKEAKVYLEPLIIQLYILLMTVIQVKSVETVITSRQLTACEV
uniref:Pr1-like protein n=1 Tax=Oryza sativa subsp. japonica TaxID=39947 RepID=Q6H6P2_ORYSJ|nr:pr1-like protein [Oryza sativa Japonica Group]BAD25607.1 pr1-like protein [Oryza sativa Japonica Group]